MTVLVGESGARYRLGEEPPVIGGQGLVYRALAEDDGFTVAVKVAREPGADGRWLEAVAARVRELSARPDAGRVLLPIWDAGRWDDRPFVVMDWCDRTLADWAPAQPLHRRIEAARALVAAVEALHRSGVVHADLKPANVMVREQEGLDLLLADLGVGPFTVGYAPPEQLAGGAPDPGWDRFALAATIWACLAGEPPTGPLRLADPSFSGAALSPDDRATFDRGAPGISAVRRQLEALLARDPRRRPRDLARLARALEGRRERAPVAGLALLAAAGLGVVGWLAWPTAAAGCPAPLVAQGGACVAADGLRVVRIGAGTFRMGGDGEADAQWTGDAPSHPVVLTRPFWLAETELTQAEWAAVTGENPVATRVQEFESGVRAPCATWVDLSLVGDDLPVVCVSWDDAVAYANARSVRDELEPAYVVEDGRVTWRRDAAGWRLPTEAEWERAARGGAAGPWGGAPERDALCGWANVRDQAAIEKWGGEVGCDDGAPVLAPVRRYQPNAYGLYDLQGNAIEWVWDWYGEYPRAAVDPAGPSIGFARIYRGSSWNHVAKGVAARYAAPPDAFVHSIGFRLARNAD